MSKLPDGWAYAKLGDLAEYINGRAFSPSEWEVSGTPIIRIQNLNNQSLPFNYTTKIFNEKFRVEKGDLLIAWSASLGAYIWKNDAAWLNQHIFKVVPRPPITTKFLFYGISQAIVELYEKVHGSGIVHVTKPIFESHLIPLPPLTDQIRITKKLDLVYQKFDSILNRLKNIDLLKQRLTDSFLNFSHDVPYPKIRLSEFLEESNIRIGKDWHGVKLIGVDTEKGITALRVSGKKSFENYKIVKQGDFIYNPMRIDIGSVAIYTDEVVALTSPDYVVFKVKNNVSSYLLLLFLKSEKGLELISKNTQGSVRSRLYFNNLSKIEMPVGPKAMQIVAEKSLMIFHKLEHKKRKLEKTLKSIRQLILIKAFKGELLLPSLADEPANELIIRLQEDKKKNELLKRKLSTDSVSPSQPSSHIILKGMSLFEIVKSHNGKISPKELWENSECNNDIEAFYSLLKREIEVNKTLKESDDKQFILVANEN